MTAPLHFPVRYPYKAMAANPHHVMSMEGGRLFFVNCYEDEAQAIEQLAKAPLGFLMQSGWVQGLARYHNGRLVDVVTMR